MKIAIAGAGMAGSYLYRLLDQEGIRADLYDQRKHTRCGGRPCAWGIAPATEYHRLLSPFVDTEQYIMKRSDHIAIDYIDMKADMLTINKPELIKGLLGDAEVRYEAIDLGAYDRVVDATGVERAYLGPTTGKELIAEMTQRRIRLEEPLGLWIRTSSIGYEYCFPLGGDEYHIGFGNLKMGTDSYKSTAEAEIARAVTICRCPSRLRMSSPYHSQPFVNGKVVGVGESIGAVGPLAGDGNIYAMETGEMLVEHWDDLDSYTDDVLRRYDWMRREREGLERLLSGSPLTMGDIRTFVQHSRRVGFGMTPRNAIRFFKKALEG